jgi:hypothetical protein
MALQLNAVLGSVVVVAGFWLVWGELPAAAALVLALAVAGLLAWRSRTIGEVWAWATGLLGLESLAWPIVTMIQIRQATTGPTDQQMGQILTAVLFGLFSSIFWLTFSYGLFKRLRTPQRPSAPDG